MNPTVMVPHDPHKLLQAIDAALTRTRERVGHDRNSLAADGQLPASVRDDGLAALDSLVRSADEVQKALAGDGRGHHEPRSPS